MKPYKQVFVLADDYQTENGYGARAVWNGQFRKPLKGEWYLDGQRFMAYKALADLPLCYPIAEIREIVAVTSGSYGEPK